MKSISLFLLAMSLSACAYRPEPSPTALYQPPSPSVSMTTVNHRVYRHPGEMKACVAHIEKIDRKNRANVYSLAKRHGKSAATIQRHFDMQNKAMLMQCVEGRLTFH